MQSEILYRRHLKKGDIFVNADLEGARPMIVKNRSTASNAPIPPSTLSQAGNLCVATSSSWESKAVMSAYWATASQVTKTAEAGGLLPTGEFLVKGEKNFLAPSQLVLGFAVMFQISKESLRNHKLAIFDEPASAEKATGEDTKAQAAEETQQIPEQTQDADETAIEEAAHAETSKELEKEQEENQSSDSEDEPENNDSVPARNPLQRDLSEPAADNLSEEAEDAGLDDDNDLKAADAHDELAEKEDGEEEDTQAEEPSETFEAYSGGRSQDTKHLSARERRQLRQGKAIESAEPAPKKEKQPVTRGKKAKAKKAAAKYADQDDEERELALRLLGANKAKAEKAAAAAEAKEKRDREIEAQKKRRKAQHDRAAEAEKRRQAMLEEGAGDDYDEETAAAEAADLDWIPALVGTPHPDDEILAAIAVCAPWASLGRYKYRTKLQPGSVKKGKAVKEILGRWISETTTGKVKKEHAEDVGIPRAVAEKMRAREGELLKTWKDTEVINTVPVGKVRIMTAGTGGDAKGKGKGGGGGGANKGGKGGKKK